MNTFSLLSLVIILFLFRCHFSSEEQKLPGKREIVSCLSDQDIKGKCDDFCEGWNKTARTDCLVEKFHCEFVESVATCFCSIEHDFTPTSEYVHRCLLGGCCGIPVECDQEGRSGGRPIAAENKLAWKCSAGGVKESCVDFCRSWDKTARSFCVVERFEDNEFDGLASCSCAEEYDADSGSVPDEEVYECLIEDCGGYKCGQ